MSLSLPVILYTLGLQTIWFFSRPISANSELLNKSPYNIYMYVLISLRYTHVCHSFLNKGSNMKCKTAKEKREIIFKSEFIASDKLLKMWKICKDRQVPNIKGSEKLRWAWAYRQNVDDLIGKIVLRGRTTFQLTLIEAFKWLTVSKALLSST